MMSDRMMEKLYELEREMVPPEKWIDIVPPEIVDMVHEEVEAGYPMGIAYDVDLGWCVLGTGQGPFFAWVEFEEKLRGL